MEWLRTLLESQPILTLFLVISLGYAAGEVTIGGFKMGVGAVLFIGLFIGALAPGAVPPGMLSTVGLILFFYCIGIQYGKAFIQGLGSRPGQRQNLIALVSLLGAGLATVAIIVGLQVPVDLAAGLFSGALVNTATLESVKHVVANELPTVGYGVAYPFGVFGPIAFIFLAMQGLKPRVQAPARQGIQVSELAVSNPKVVGKRLSEVLPQFPPEVQVIAIKQDGHNWLPRGSLKLRLGDELMVEGEGESLSKARSLIGEDSPIDMFGDRRDLDTLILYVSHPRVIGRKIGELNLTENPGCAIVSVLRGDSELYAHPGLVLEGGDRVQVITEYERFSRVRAFFGDASSSTAEVGYLELGIGMVLGVLLGLIPFPIPGLGTFTFGAAGGALIVALLLGWQGRTGHLTWTLPISANLTLRNFGVTLFLAVAGMRSAEQFVTTVKETGLILVGAGIVITAIAVLLTMVIGYGVMRLPFDDLVGVVAGVTGNPAILSYASSVVPTNKPELGYAMVFPASTILKIIVIQIILAWFL